MLSYLPSSCIRRMKCHTCRHQDFLLGAAVTGAEQGARNGDAQVQAL